MPIFSQPILTRLLGSIEAGNLVVLCGAGLSIPEPSNLMSAVRVSRACYDKWFETEQLPRNMRDDVDALVQARVASCSQWMNLHLPGKDLLIVGFWTDW